MSEKYRSSIYEVCMIFQVNRVGCSDDYGGKYGTKQRFSTKQAD